MRIHVIACRVLTRELSYLAAMSPNIIEITWLPQGLHQTPDALRISLADEIRTIEENVRTDRTRFAPEAIAFGYGLCSNGVLGLESGDIPLVVPRTDDCIALLLGAQARYLEQFQAHSGTYWLSSGWVELSAGTKQERAKRRERRFRQYAERFDEESAEYLLEQEEQWAHNYNRCALIDLPVHQSPAYEQAAHEMAQENGWAFERVQGSLRLMEKLLNGQWNEEEFCICPPHHRLVAAYDGTKLCAQALEGGAP